MFAFRTGARPVRKQNETKKQNTPQQANLKVGTITRIAFHIFIVSSKLPLGVAPGSFSGLYFEPPNLLPPQFTLRPEYRISNRHCLFGHLLHLPQRTRCKQSAVSALLHSEYGVQMSGDVGYDDSKGLGSSLRCYLPKVRCQMLRTAEMAQMIMNQTPSA